MKRAISLLMTVFLLLTFIPSAAMAKVNGEYEYTVDSIYFTDLEETTLEQPKNGCFANVQVTKKHETDSQDFITLSAYATDNSFIGLYFLKGSVDVGESGTFAVTVNIPAGKTLGKVKAFVISDIASLNALSETVTVECELGDGEIAPPEIDESYLLNKFTFAGYITANNRTNSSRYDKNEYELLIEDIVVDYESCKTSDEYDALKKRIEDSLNYHGLYLDGDNISIEVNSVVGFNATDLFRYGNFDVKITNGNYTITGFEPFDEGNIVRTNTNLFDDEDYYNNDSIFADPNRAYVRFYETADALKSKKYNLSEDFVIYINGVEAWAEEEIIERYLCNNICAEVVLLDFNTKYNKADGKYDVIFVEYEAVASVGAVSSNKITFNSYYNPGERVSNIVLDPEDEDLTYNIYYNGEEIDISELKINDILNIEYDVTSGLDNSYFYDIIVSRDIAEGKYISRNDMDGTVTIGDKTYSFVQGYSESDALMLGYIYKLYLDSKGRIFDYKKTGLSAWDNYAIIDKYTKSSEDDYYRASLYDILDGEIINPEVDTTKVSMTDDDILNSVYVDYNIKSDISKRIVKYKVSSSTGRIVALEFVSPSRTVNGGEYNAALGTIGNIHLDDTTKIVNAVDYLESNKKLSELTMDRFIDDESYSVYAIGERNEDGVYPIAVIVSATRFTEKEEEEIFTEGYAIIDKYTKSSADDYYRAALYNIADGETITPEVNVNKIGMTNADLASKVYIDPSDSSEGKVDIRNRVVKYKMSQTTGRVVALEFVAVECDVDYTQYSESTNSIGNVTLGNNTQIVNAVDYVNLNGDLSKLAVDNFVNGENYTISAYGQGVNNVYPVVLVIDASALEVEEEEETFTEGYAIIDKYTKSSADDYYRAKLYLASDGTVITPEVDTNKVSMENSEILEMVYRNPSNVSNGKNDITGRVVQYKISSSSGRIVGLEFVPADRIAMDAYSKATNSIGEIYLDDTTQIIDAIEYVGSYEIPTCDDLHKVTKDDFIDEGEYEVYAFGEESDNHSYPLLLVTSAGGAYNYETNIAILKSTPSPAIDPDTLEDYYRMEVLYQGEEFEGDWFIRVNEDVRINGVNDPLELSKGDVIVFVKDRNENVELIDVLITAEDLGVDNGYEGVLREAFDSDGPAVVSIPADSNNWTTSWTAAEDSYDINANKKITRILYGPVVEKKANYFRLASVGKADDEEINPYGGYGSEYYTGLFTNLAEENGVGGVIDVDINSNTKVYVYDFMKTNSKLQLNVGSTADITANILNKACLFNDGDYIAWNGCADVYEEDVQYGTVFAFAKVVDGTATDVYVILPN